MFKRSWVQIPSPDTRRTFLTFICCKIYIVCLKRPKIDDEQARDGPFQEEISSEG